MVIAKYRLKHFGDFKRSELTIIAETREAADEKLMGIIPRGLIETVEGTYHEGEMPCVVSLESEKGNFFLRGLFNTKFLSSRRGECNEYFTVRQGTRQDKN